MARTIEKAILGILLVFALGIGSVLVTANLAETNADDAKSTALNAVTQDADELTDVNDEAEEYSEDVAIIGNALEQASAAALVYLGEGRVTDTEVGDEEGFYEIELTLNSGRQVDVHLDENFKILGQE